MAHVILFFASNADALYATKALKNSGVRAKLVPKPAGVRVRGNLCLSVEGRLEANALAALGKAHVTLGGVVK